MKHQIGLNVILRPTIKDIAQRANVSPSTVSLVLRNENTCRASLATKQKILRIADELDYRPNYIARSLVARESKTIGLVIPALINPFYANLANDVIDRAKEKGYSVLLRSVRDDIREEHSAFLDLLDRGVDGIIISSAQRKDYAIQKLLCKNYPIVLVVRDIEQNSETDSIDFVGVNNHLGGYLAMEHLIQHGHRRIALLMGPQSTSNGHHQYQGALKAMDNYGISHDETLIRFSNFEREAGKLLMLNILAGQKVPTAVLAGSDIIALGVLEALRKKDLTVPKDVALVAFDDTLLAGTPGLDLTTVSQHKIAMGKLGVDYLVNKLTDKNQKTAKRTIINPVLLVRRSCGCNESS